LAFSYWFDKPRFLTEGKLAAVLIIPFLGVPNWSVIYINTAPQSVSQTYREKELPYMFDGFGSDGWRLINLGLTFSAIHDRAKALFNTVVQFNLSTVDKT
jgi:hypothetical protein